jgi:hypothetical protein
VTDAVAEDQPARFSLTLTPEAVNIAEEGAALADARIRGDTAAWIRAFSPQPDRSGLNFIGDLDLSEAVLSALAPEAPRAANPSIEAA